MAEACAVTGERQNSLTTFFHFSRDKKMVLNINDVKLTVWFLVIENPKIYFFPVSSMFLVDNPLYINPLFPCIINI